MRQIQYLFTAIALTLALGVQASLAQTSGAARLAAADEPASAIPAPVALNTAYRISGERSLRPARISDDGVHTYIEWSEDQALPAVFARNAVGGEEMVDGFMRGGVFTIDSINPELIFRIDKKSAKALRDSGKK